MTESLPSIADLIAAIDESHRTGEPGSARLPLLRLAQHGAQLLTWEPTLIAMLKLGGAVSSSDGQPARSREFVPAERSELLDVLKSIGPRPVGHLDRALVEAVRGDYLGTDPVLRMYSGFVLSRCLSSDAFHLLAQGLRDANCAELAGRCLASFGEGEGRQCVTSEQAKLVVNFFVPKFIIHGASGADCQIQRGAGIALGGLLGNHSVLRAAWPNLLGQLIDDVMEEVQLEAFKTVCKLGNAAAHVREHLIRRTDPRKNNEYIVKPAQEALVAIEGI